MGSSGQEKVTQLLLQLEAGDQESFNRLLPVVYDELKRLAHSYLRSERSGHTLNTTALVHEAYIKLVGHDNLSWENRVHFFATAAQAMRRILLDYARKRRTAKRGAGQVMLSLDEAVIVGDEQAESLLALDEALIKLEAMDERLGKIVECKYFGGLTVEETALALSLSTATVKRDWRTARAWLYRALNDSEQPDEPNT